MSLFPALCCYCFRRSFHQQTLPRSTSSLRKRVQDLCKKIVTAQKHIACTACTLRVLATQYVDPQSLEANVASRLIPLDKNPGVRPIGIGEVIRRILGKASLYIIGNDIQEAAGCLQLSAGQKSGVEAAIHAMQQAFDQDETEAVLMADATNAFNQLNRNVCLRNMRYVCPSLATIVINTYRHPAKLFVGGTTIMSAEGTTQGDPNAMPMYATGVLPIIQSLSAAGLLQLWFADDSSAAGRLRRLHAWWDLLCAKGPSYDYLANPSKSVLVVKPTHLEEATTIFADTGVIITQHGHRFLGSAIGSPDFVADYLGQKATTWTDEVVALAEVAKSQPQAAYSAFTQGLKHRSSFLCRVVRSAASALAPLEDAITTHFLPAVCGRLISQEDRDLLAFPCRDGGLGIINPTKILIQYQASLEVTSALVSKILDQEKSLENVAVAVRNAKRKVANQSWKATSEAARHFSASRGGEVQHCMQLASEKGASSWLTCRALKSHSSTPSKGEFWDGLALRYGWQPARLPSTCACGVSFSVAHALSCPLGGFPSLRHNEVRDLTAHLLKRVANNVVIEPHLLPVTRESFRHRSAITDAQARLDVAASGIWGGRFDPTFLDVRVFSPFARSNRSTSVPSSYQRHGREKRRCYEERVSEIEHASFVPVVLSTSGGMGRSATSLFKRITDLLAEKTKDAYSVTMSWLRCRVSFALLRACIACLRGARRHLPEAMTASAALAVAKAHIH